MEKELTNEQIRESIQNKINASEKRIERLQNQMKDPAVFLESGYYLQQDYYNEIAYCNALYSKLQSLN